MDTLFTFSKNCLNSTQQKIVIFPPTEYIPLKQNNNRYKNASLIFTKLISPPLN